MRLVLDGLENRELRGAMASVRVAMDETRTKEEEYLL